VRILAAHFMELLAAPVACTFKQPSDVSALSTIDQPEGLACVVILDVTRTVVPALASRLIIPAISQDPTSVPSEAFLLAITVPENVIAVLFCKVIWFTARGVYLSVFSAIGVALVVK